MRRKKVPHPKIVALAQHATNQSSHDTDASPQASLLQRLVATDPRQSRHRVKKVVTYPATRGAASTNHPHQDDDNDASNVIDTPDKLLAYALHIVMTQTAVAPRRIQLKQIVTLADAVFAPARQPIEITYLQHNPAPPCGFTNLYWLMPVHEMDLRETYFTLTSHGLTHVVGMDTELHDVATWLTEKAIFDQIVQMPCIQLMRKMTTFHGWKHNTIGDRFRRARKHLAQKLLWCVPAVRPYVLPIRSLVLQVESVLATRPIVEITRTVTLAETHAVDRGAMLLEVHALVRRVEELVVAALLPLTMPHDRVGAHAASTDVIPIFIRVVDFMLLQVGFDAVVHGMEQLFFSITGMTVVTDLLSSAAQPSAADDDDRDAPLDIHSQVDRLLASPFEHSGEISYKRFFQLQGAVRPPDPLFFVRIAMSNGHDGGGGGVVVVTPDKEAWLRKLHDLVAEFVRAVDSIGRIAATPRVRDFVHAHCRPYFRQFFAEKLHPLAAVVFNHPLVASTMKSLRWGLDIYFAEIEYLASTCAPLKAEFHRMKALALPTTTTPPTSVAHAMDTVVDVTSVVRTYVAFQRELKVVDSMLQVGCFLVDRSSFVGDMLHECSARLVAFYDALPAFVKRFLKDATDELAATATTLASIPESVDECIDWLECCCNLQRETDRATTTTSSSSSHSPLLHVEPHVASLKQIIHGSGGDVLQHELHMSLVHAFEAGQLQLEFKMKAVRDCLARISANHAFYHDLFGRTLASRRELLLSDFETMAARLDDVLATLRVFDDADGGGGVRGAALQNLLQLVRALVTKNTQLTHFQSLLDQFKAATGGPIKPTLRQHSMLR
ncbi:hypothetical protein As57867_015276, partial [Aphanomyces stellatus]